MTESTESTEIQTTEPKREQRREPKPRLAAGAEISPIVPRDIDELGRVANLIMNAGLVPDGYDLSEKEAKGLSSDQQYHKYMAKVMSAIMKGAEVGLAPLTALAYIAPINNRPTVYGQGVVALLQASGYLANQEVEWTGPEPADEINRWPDEFGVTVKLWRRGQSTPYTGEFTVGKARRAGLWAHARRKPWMYHPTDMLFWRAYGRAASRGFSDCLAGLSIREIAEDDIQPEAAEERKTDTAFLDDKPELQAPEDAQNATDVAPDTAEAEDTAETEGATPEAPDEPEDAAPADEDPAEPAEAMPDLVDGAQETPEQEARRHAERAIMKLAEAETTDAINEAWRLYGEGACDALRAAGLASEADQLKESFSRAAMEPAQT